MNVPNRVKVAVDRFMEALGSTSKPGVARHLVEAAFLLYHLDWDGHDVREWQWPFQELKSGGGFPGLAPWAVLLRAAAAMRTDVVVGERGEYEVRTKAWVQTAGAPEEAAREAYALMRDEPENVAVIEVRKVGSIDWAELGPEEYAEQEHKEAIS
jgi:hypothetical protein